LSTALILIACIAGWLDKKPYLKNMSELIFNVAPLTIFIIGSCITSIKVA